MQATGYRNTWDCVTQTYKKEGVRGFFRGVVPPLLTISFLRAVSFTAYEHSKIYLLPPPTDAAASSAATSSERTAHTTLKQLAVSCFAAGMVSGAFLGAIGVPLDMIKVQMQLARLRMPTDDLGLNKKKKAETSFKMIHQIVKKQGILGLFYGAPIHIGILNMGAKQRNSAGFSGNGGVFLHL